MKYLRLNEILEDVKQAETITFEHLLFNGGENHIKLQSPVSEEVTIEAQLVNSDYVMALFLATDALRRSGAKDISLLCPYVPYARQDRVMVEGEPLSIKVFAEMLNAQNYKAVYTLDNHSPVSTVLIDNCIEICNARILANFIKPTGILVSPDAGAYKKSCETASRFGLTMVCASKIRRVDNGEITETKVDVTDLRGKDCYIIDDICDGGRTFVELGKILKQRNSGEIILYVSHGIFSNGVDSLKEYIDKIYTTNMFRNDKGIEKWGVNIIGLRKEDLR